MNELITKPQSMLFLVQMHIQILHHVLIYKMEHFDHDSKDTVFRDNIRVINFFYGVFKCITNIFSQFSTL